MKYRTFGTFDTIPVAIVRGLLCCSMCNPTFSALSLSLIASSFALPYPQRHFDYGMTKPISLYAKECDTFAVRFRIEEINTQNSVMYVALLKLCCRLCALYSHGRQCTRQVDVVAVQPGEDLAVRATEPLVDGIALTVVLLATPIMKITVVLLDDLAAAVGTPAIHHNILEVGIALEQDRADGFFEILGLVV